MHIVYAKLGQADAGDNEAKLLTKLAPEWVRTSDPVIRSPARYRWTTAPAHEHVQDESMGESECIDSKFIWKQDMADKFNSSLSVSMVDELTKDLDIMRIYSN